MSLSFRAQTVELGARPLRILIIEPTRPLMVGMERLSSPTTATSASPVDRAIAAAARSTGAELTVFNARVADGSGQWGIDPSLSDERADSVADHLMSTQVITERTLLASGVHGHVRVGMSPVDFERLGAARQRLTKRLEAELEQVGRADHRRDSLETALWLSRHFAFLFDIDLDRFLAETIFNQRAVFDRQLDRVERYVAARPRC